jgi:hypothetical protein
MTVCAEARVRKERVARKRIAMNDPRIIVSCVGWTITATVAGKNRHSQVFFNKASSSSVSIAEVV